MRAIRSDVEIRMRGCNESLPIHLQHPPRDHPYAGGYQAGSGREGLPTDRPEAAKSEVESMIISTTCERAEMKDIALFQMDQEAKRE